MNGLWKALNRQLPRDIRLIGSQQVSDEFHSRFAANQRHYLYQINTRANVLDRQFKWLVKYPLETLKLHELAAHIRGEHDFSSFCYAGTETENMVCNIASATWEEDPSGGLRFSIVGDRFLHHMVRMLVGSMVEVARGKWEIEYFAHLLSNPNRKSHTVTAPANGLALMKVGYPDTIQPNWDMERG